MKEVIKKCEEKMTKTCENLDGEFANIRAGRANPNLLNRIMVEYYGTPTPMQQVGNISVPEPRIIQIFAGFCHLLFTFLNNFLHSYAPSVLWFLNLIVFPFSGCYMSSCNLAV